MLHAWLIFLNLSVRKMSKIHNYSCSIRWTGNKGNGTKSYTAYERSHLLEIGGKPTVALSSDQAFRGDKLSYNPEELLVASLASCHMLWYLHLCAANGIVVVAYTDNATGIMDEMDDGSGCFKEVTLRPDIVIAKEGNMGLAHELHDAAHQKCFIANSVNFPVHCRPAISEAG